MIVMVRICLGMAGSGSQLETGSRRDQKRDYIKIVGTIHKDFILPHVFTNVVNPGDTPTIHILYY